MFGTLFLGAVLAAFLTLGVVRGDAERGLLQPLVVRPLGRSSLLLPGASPRPRPSAPPTCSSSTRSCCHHADGRRLVARQLRLPGIQLASASLIIAALWLLGSVFLSATANGIAVFMVFGAGLVAGLLGQIGEAINSQTLQTSPTGRRGRSPSRRSTRTRSTGSRLRVAASQGSRSS